MNNELTTKEFTPEEIRVIKGTIAKDTNDMELAYFLNVCKTVNLNPFMKEVWCYKDGKGNIIIFASRDGFLKKAQENPAFNGIRSCEICSKDEYEIDIPNGIVHHKITNINDRGEIICAYAIVFRKGGESTIEISDFKVYNKNYNTWKTHPAEMIKKVAEVHALKKAFGISIVQSEYDWEINAAGQVQPINTIEIPTVVISEKITKLLQTANLNGMAKVEIEKRIKNGADEAKVIEYLKSKGGVE